MSNNSRSTGRVRAGGTALAYRQAAFAKTANQPGRGRCSRALALIEKLQLSRFPTNVSCRQVLPAHDVAYLIIVDFRIVTWIDRQRLHGKHQFVDSDSCSGNAPRRRVGECLVYVPGFQYDGDALAEVRIRVTDRGHAFDIHVVAKR